MSVRVTAILFQTGSRYRCILKFRYNYVNYSILLELQFLQKYAYDSSMESLIRIRVCRLAESSILGFIITNCLGLVCISGDWFNVYTLWFYPRYHIGTRKFPHSIWKYIYLMIEFPEYTIYPVLQCVNLFPKWIPMNDVIGAICVSK